MWRQAETFVLASDDPDPGDVFVGKAYVGPDLILGAPGAKAYQDATGAAIPGDEDGCYLSIRRDGRQLRIENDYMGNMPIFTYSEGGRWAVSNSLRRLAMHLREAGRRLTPNPPQVEAFAIDDAFTKQLTSFETVFREIRLLPSFCGLAATADGLSVRPREAAENVDYATGLAEFLSVWQGRFGALLADKSARVTVDISGGIDSRTVLAMLVRAVEAGGAGMPPSLSYHTSNRPHHARDKEVATGLASAFGLSLARREGNAGPFLTAAAMVDRWEDMCLGVYSPLRLGDPSVAPQIKIKIGGGGGESFREFYHGETLEGWLQERQKRFSSDEAFAAWKDPIIAALRQIEDHWGGGEHPLVLHYREFRARLHAGSQARVTTQALPLQSKLLFRAARSCTREHLARRQIAFDIISSTVPQMADFPFDLPKKRFSKENRRNLQLVSVTPSRQGRIYRGAAETDGKLRKGKPDAYSEMLRRLKRLEPRFQGRADWREQFEAAKALLETARAQGSFSKRRDAGPLFRALLTDLVSIEGAPAETPDGATAQGRIEEKALP